MALKITVKRKFIVNGKEYGSLEEMPEDIRRAYEQGLTVPTGADGFGVSGTPKVKITFNGQVYGSVEAMPADVRHTYEQVMASVKGVLADGGPTTRIEAGLPQKGSVGHDASNWSISLKPIEPGSPAIFSSRWLAIGVVILGLIAAVYFLLPALWSP
jgi:hypothetical protein